MGSHESMDVDASTSWPAAATTNLEAADRAANFLVTQFDLDVIAAGIQET